MYGACRTRYIDTYSVDRTAIAIADGTALHRSACNFPFILLRQGAPSQSWRQVPLGWQTDQGDAFASPLIAEANARSRHTLVAVITVVVFSGRSETSEPAGTVRTPYCIPDTRRGCCGADYNMYVPTYVSPEFM